MKKNLKFIKTIAIFLLGFLLLQSHIHGNTHQQRNIDLDFRYLNHYYHIVYGIHEKYKAEFGHLPEAIQKNFKNEIAAYDELQNILYCDKNYTHKPSFWYTVELILWYCADMYNKEMNDLFGSNFSPIDDSPFLNENFLCNTSYQEALKMILELSNKYSYMKKDPKTYL